MISAAVITSSIGRAELRQSIESVRAQTHKARHYVFVNGEKWHESAREVLRDYPEVCAVYLPEETGDYGMGPSMADVFVSAPYLTRADWVFFLNDDDFYDPNHIESILAHAKVHDLKWAYSLRKFVDKDGSLICDDDWNSLGYWPCLAEAGEYLVDNSCFAVSRTIAQKMGPAWTFVPYVADRCFLAALKHTGEPYGCTGLSTVNYRIGTGTAESDAGAYLKCAETARSLFPDGFPWRTPSVFR